MLKLFAISSLMLLVLIIPFALPLFIVAITKRTKKAGAANVCYSGFPQQPYDQNGQQNFSHQPAPRQNRPDLTVSTILFLIGTCFVVLSGLAFGAASWVRTSHEGRAAIIAAAAGISFLLCTFVYKFLRLSGTAISFYSLGTGLTATLIITAGYYELMGEWFSLKGAGFAALIACACGVSTVLFFIGSRVFGKKVFSYLGLSAFFIAIFFGSLQLAGGTFDIFSAILMGIQTVVTALIYAVKPSGKRNVSAPVKIVGTAASIFYALVAFIYALISFAAPTAFTYIIMGLIISQLIFYGALMNNKAFIAVETVFSIITAYLAAFTAGIELSSRMSVIVFGVIVIGIYLIHRFIPFFRNAFSEIFSLCAVIFAGFADIIQADKSGFVPELLIASAAALIIALYVFSKNKGAQIAAGLCTPVFPVLITAALQGCISRSFTAEESDTINVLCWSGLVFVFIAFAAVILLLPRLAFAFHARHPRKTDTALYTLLIAAGTILLPISGYSNVFMVPAALSVLHFALSNRLRFNITAIFPVLSVTILTYSAADYYSDGEKLPVTIAMLALFIIFIVVSKAVYPNAFAEKKNDRYIVDTLLLSAWLPLLLMLSYNKTGLFMALIAAGLYTIGFIKKRTGRVNRRVSLTIASVMIIAALHFRPFLVPGADAISAKICIAMFVLAGILCRLIWRADKDAAKLPSNIIFIIAFSGLLFDMLIYKEALNIIFGMSVMLFILLVSIIIKNRTWFLTSSVALFTVTLYYTREYIMSLSWWVYLFFAGLILIVIAAANEYYKTKGETVKSTVAKTFSEWNW